MDFGTTLIVIAGIGAWYSLRTQRIKSGGGSGMPFGRNRHRHVDAPVDPLLAAPSPRENELEREVEALRERIHVLERIATDANSTKQRQTRALADEIESLRDR
jgi:hypothetical protein